MNRADIDGGQTETAGSYLQSLDARITEIEGRLPALEDDLVKAIDELSKSQVIRRHVARNPEKFSPHERENMFEQAQAVAVKKAELEATVESERRVLALLEETRTLVSELAGRPPDPEARDIADAVESERLRIARELHEGPAQVLSNLVLEAEILERLLRRDPSQLKDELQEFKQSVRSAVEDMRRFMFGLRPASVDELGLVATMRRIAAEYSNRTGVACRFNLVGDERPLPAPIEEALYWIIQEALTNVHSHAQATTVEVTLEMAAADAIVLRVRDDGQGFDPEDYQEEGAPQKKGVTGMRERAAAVGGQLEVRGQPGSGTLIEAALPLS